MDNILDNFSRDANIWKLEPQLLAVKEFANLYDQDKSKDKTRSSKIMWGLVFLIHPDSVFRDLDERDREELVAKDYIGDKSFDFNTVKEESVKLRELMLTRAKRSLDAWETKLRERDKFIENTPYNIETADHLDKILKNTADLWKQYKSIREDVLKEGSMTIDKGSKTPSLSDDGRI